VLGLSWKNVQYQGIMMIIVPRIAALAILFCMAQFSIAAGSTAAAQAQSPEPARTDVTGVWIDHTGRGAVEIAPCGAKLCGSIAWVQDPVDKQGKPLVDINNPDRAKRGRKICGLPIIGNTTRQKGDVWDNGWIYDPDEGKTFDVELRLKSTDVLQVTGYLGTKFFGETFLWRRAPPSQARCSAT
jgi:uncharacterized protein (DUF2147 family)